MSESTDKAIWLVRSMKISFRPKRRQPRAGDRKTVNGVEYIRQQVLNERERAYEVRNGRPVYEWVEVGSERDRSAVRARIPEGT